MRLDDLDKPVLVSQLGLNPAVKLSRNCTINPIETQKASRRSVPLPSTLSGRCAKVAELLGFCPYIGFLLRCYSDPRDHFFAGARTGGGGPRPSMSALWRRGSAQQRASIHHHIPSRYQRSRPVNLDDHAAKADMDAHSAMHAVRQDGRCIGDMPPMRLDRAPGLAPQGRKCPLSIQPRGQNFIREVLMQVYGDLWQDCLLWLETTEIRAAEIAAQISS